MLLPDLAEERGDAVLGVLERALAFTAAAHAGRVVEHEDPLDPATAGAAEESVGREQPGYEQRQQDDREATQQ